MRYIPLRFSRARLLLIFSFFFFNDTATTEIYTLSLHDALPISAYGFRDFLASGDPVIRADPTRIAAQIVTGIGFLGAGAIIRQGLSIRGLTTAATLWVSAAVGIAAGAGYYSGAVLATAVTLFALW